MSNVSGYVGVKLQMRYFVFPVLSLVAKMAIKRGKKTGQTDLKRLPERIKKHQTCAKHINFVIDLSHLGRANIAVASNTGHQLYISCHNEELRKNRTNLSKIIDCEKFCGFYKLPLRDHDEESDSINLGVFWGFLDRLCC